MPQDRGGDPKRKASQPLNVVRGGAVCQQGEPGAHVVAGSNSAAVCMPTVGSDTRPRWKSADNLNAHPQSRHSVRWAQHRGTASTQQGLQQKR